MPKTMRRFCRFKCRKHTVHKVAQYKKGKELFQDMGKTCYDNYINVVSDLQNDRQSISDLYELITSDLTKGKIYSLVCFDKELQLIKIIKEEGENND